MRREVKMILRASMYPIKSGLTFIVGYVRYHMILMGRRKVQNTAFRIFNVNASWSEVDKMLRRLVHEQYKPRKFAIIPANDTGTVSYTHLTLPSILLV